MTKTVLNKALCAVAALAVTATGFSAASAQSRIVRTAVVHYADLDLTSAAGKETFEGRIKGAVRKVCGGYDARNFRDVADHGNCMKEAKQSANRAKVSVLAAAAAGEPTSGEIAVGS